MNDVRGAFGVLCGVLVSAFLMAWNALLQETYLAATINAAASILFWYTLSRPNSTLVSVLSRPLRYVGRLPSELLAFSLFLCGVHLFVIGENPGGLAVAIACPTILKLWRISGLLEAASPKAVDDHDYCHRHQHTAQPSDDTPTTKMSGSLADSTAKSTIWAHCRCIVSWLNTLLLASILGFVASQFIVSITVSSIMTRPVFIDDARLFGSEMLFDTNITEVSVAINITEVTAEANLTESKPQIIIPVNTFPDFITAFGTQTQAVPAPAPVAKSTWAPASSTAMPTAEPTPSKIPEPEPEPEPEIELQPEPEPEPTPEAEQWIMPDEVFPVFQLMANKHISQAKSVLALWADLETEFRYGYTVLACVVVWSLLPLFACLVAGSTAIAVGAYASSLLFPLLQNQGQTVDQSLTICMAVGFEITLIASYVLWRLLRWSAKAQSNTAVHDSYPDMNEQLTQAFLQGYAETDENVRMYVESEVKHKFNKLLHDTQLHAMIAHSILLAMQGPAKTPMHTAAWQSITQQMWLQLVQQPLAACLRMQQQAHNTPADALPAESSDGRAGSPDDSAAEAFSNAHNNDLLLADCADACSRGGALGLDVDGDDGADSTTRGSGGSNLLADLDYLGENGRLMGEDMCRTFARLLHSDYPAKKATRRGKRKSQKAARAQQHGSESEQSDREQVDDPSQHDEQPQQDAQPEQQPEPEQHDQPGQEAQREQGLEAEQKPSPEQETSPELPAEPEQHAQPEKDDTPGSPSTGDDASDNSSVPNPADPAPTAEDEDKDSSSDAQQGGDDNTTPLPTPNRNGLGDSRWGPQAEQPPTSSSDDTGDKTDDGDAPGTSNVDGPGDGDNITPVPTPQPKKGLGISRWAPEQTPAGGNDDTGVSHTGRNINDGEMPNTTDVDGQGGDDKVAPVPTPQPNKGLGESRWGPEAEQPSTSSGGDKGVDNTAGNIDGGKTPSNPHVDGQGGNNDVTPVPTPKPSKGLGDSRFADDQPSAGGNGTRSQPRHGTSAAPTASTGNSGLSGSQRAREPFSDSGSSNSRPMAQHPAAVGVHRPTSPLAPSPARPQQAPAPYPPRGQPLCQDKSTRERLLETSKYRHEDLYDQRFYGKSDREINQYYRRENDLRVRHRKEEPLVRPYKFPDDPEASYRIPPKTAPSVANNNKSKKARNNGNKWNKGGYGKGGQGNKA